MSTEYRFLVVEIAKRMEESSALLEMEHKTEATKWENQKMLLNKENDRL
jgi:hypothetical protein